MSAPAASQPAEPMAVLVAATRLASALARPPARARELATTGLATSDLATSGLAPAGAAEAAAQLARHRAFARPLDRFFARRLGFDRLPIGRAHVERQVASPRSRLALCIATGAEGDIDRATLLLAAAIVHRQVVAAVRREARQRIVGVLGEEATTLAFREAPVLHAPLGALDRSGLAERAAREDVEPEAARHELRALGWAGLSAFVAATEPDFGPLMALRGRDDPAAGDRLAPFDAVHADHVFRLMHRTMPPWRDSAS